MKRYEALRIEPISISWGTGLNLGRAVGTTSQGGAINLSDHGIGDFSILVGAQMGATASISGETVTAAKYMTFTVYESTAATHAGSAITGATMVLGCATAGVARGLYDAFLSVTSDLTTTVNVKINNIDYHTTLTGPGQDGSAVALELANSINGKALHAGHPKLPHYTAYTGTGGVFIASGVIYIAPDDDQATGLVIEMSAVSDTIVPRMNKLQGIIDINAHALSTNRPKWISIGNSTYTGSTGCYYAFLLRDGARTPGKLTALNT